jgi:hypothetical protein
MPCLAHLDANGKFTHTNRKCKFVNDLKADLEASYKHARKNHPLAKGGKQKEEAKEPSGMDEDEAMPEPNGESATKSKNPFDKKNAIAYHTFLRRPTSGGCVPLHGPPGSLRRPHGHPLSEELR